MRSYLANKHDMHDLARFLATLNSIPSSNIGFCGTDPEEIFQTLNEDFIDQSGNLTFMVTRDETNEIIAAIGLDIDEQTAEVWGPYAKTVTYDLEDQLWQQLVKTYPNIDKYLFFINQENTEQLAFVENLPAEKTGEHMTLKMKKEHAQSISTKRSVLFKDDDFYAFETLHNEAFPNTYYDASTIVSRLNIEHILNVIKTKDNQLQGYAYYEIDEQHAEASLEYIAIDPVFRNKGLGTLLLTEIVDEIFSNPNITEIKLCVNNTNASANHVYFKAGFELEENLYSYEVDRMI